jgi:hypothetical protein
MVFSDRLTLKERHARNSSWPGERISTIGRVHLRRLIFSAPNFSLAVARRTIHFQELNVAWKAFPRRRAAQYLPGIDRRGERDPKGDLGVFRAVDYRAAASRSASRSCFFDPLRHENRMPKRGRVPPRGAHGEHREIAANALLCFRIRITRLLYFAASLT